MRCEHKLGVHADYDGNTHFVFKPDELDQLYPTEKFQFCPDCGQALNCEHVWEAATTSLNSLYSVCEARCSKCGYLPNKV